MPTAPDKLSSDLPYRFDDTEVGTGIRSFQQAVGARRPKAQLRQDGWQYFTADEGPTLRHKDGVWEAEEAQGKWRRIEDEETVARLAPLLERNRQTDWMSGMSRPGEQTVLGSEAGPERRPQAGETALAGGTEAGGRLQVRTNSQGQRYVEDPELGRAIAQRDLFDLSDRQRADLYRRITGAQPRDAAKLQPGEWRRLWAYFGEAQ